MTDSHQPRQTVSEADRPATPPWAPGGRRRALVLMALIVGGWSLLRLVGLYGMRAFRELEFRPLHLVQGVVSEVCWLLALVALGGLVSRLTGYPARATGQASADGAARRWLIAAGFALLCALVVTLRAADTMSCYFALAHMTAAGWAHVSLGSVGYLLDPRFLSFVVVVVLSGAALSRVLVQIGAAFPRHATRQIIAGGVVSALVWITPALQQQDPHHWAIVPEVNAAWALVRSLTHGRHVDPTKVVVTPLTDATAKRLQAAGILPHGVKPNAPYPLLRRDYGKRDPLTLRQNRPAGLVEIAALAQQGAGAAVGNPPQEAGDAARKQGQRPPNVLIVLVESLSAGFTGLHPKSRHRTLMPNLSRLAKRMTRVDGFHNIASPTANGLIASLCATLPASAVQDLEVGGSVDGQAAYRCLSDVLRERGYTTRFIRGASKVYMACEATLRGHGFDAVTGREDLVKRYGDRPTNSWGYDDKTLVDELGRQLRELKEAKQPWMLATLTVGTHLPGFPDKDCPVPSKLQGESVLAGYFCADRQLGRLFKLLDELQLWENTLVVLTGDHAQLPTNEVKRLIGEPALFGTFAPMPLLIHDPLHALPKRVEVLSGQLDLAPTLLHLLGAPGVEHSFLGYSIFGERRSHPFLFGRVGSRSAYVQSPSLRRELTLAALDRACELTRPLLADGSAPISACDLAHFFGWLDTLWRGQRLFPRDRYTGGKGANAALLRLKWLRYDAKEARQRQHQAAPPQHGATPPAKP